MNKAELRKIIKEKQLSFLSEPAYRINESFRICKEICNSKEFLNADTIFAFMPLKDEVSIGGVITEAFLKNKKVAVPLITDKNGIMTFHWIDQDTVMNEGSFGIYEPPENPVNPTFVQTNALLLIPGLAFSKDGKRLGRGKGFYDRFLAQYPDRFIKAGVCFSFQIMEDKDFPADENDMPVDILFN